MALDGTHDTAQWQGLLPGLVLPLGPGQQCWAASLSAAEPLLCPNRGSGAVPVVGARGSLPPPAGEEPTRSLAFPHTEGCLFFICRGIVASILVFLCFGVTQAKDGPFSRPHPGNLPFLSPCVPVWPCCSEGHSVSVLLRVSVPSPLGPLPAGRLHRHLEAPPLWALAPGDPPPPPLLPCPCPLCASQRGLPAGGGARGSPVLLVWPRAGGCAPPLLGGSQGAIRSHPTHPGVVGPSGNPWDIPSQLEGLQPVRAPASPRGRLRGRGGEFS